MNSELKKSLENLSENSKNVTELLNIGNSHIINIENNTNISRREIKKSNRILNKLSRSFSKIKSWSINGYSNITRIENTENEEDREKRCETVEEYLDNIYKESIKHQLEIKRGNDILNSSLIKLDNNKEEIENNINQMKKILNK